ncbi:hypothetical protein [Streptomyces sp. LS1784]|uniref:hypothetical protein n=1 Tax=Streptomyces sp. LS1784 TaxID=2851533 RepID=UPI001CCF9345|nr:hypothetical protein [Streptomyces sp. LS1784]
MTIPPPPSEPPTIGALGPDSDPVVGEWWRKDGPVYTPVPIGTGHGQAVQAASVAAAAEAFWAPAREIFAEQATTIASAVGETIDQLFNETPAQRAARQQVEYEAMLAAQRARMDAALGKVGETPKEKTERHRVEDILTPSAPTQRDDLVGLVDLLADRLSETPEDRAARQATQREVEKQRARAREDARLAAAGETPAQRALRHRQQQLANQREARARARRQRLWAARAKVGGSARYRRFRRWCTLTAISAVGGYSLGLVPLLGTGGPAVGALAAAFGWGLDLHTRDKGRLRVSEVRGPGPLLILTVLRIPVASGLAVALGLGPLLPSLHLFN